jgi:predicted RNase H-like nuclease (RuvC/YqgF family)
MGWMAMNLAYLKSIHDKARSSKSIISLEKEVDRLKKNLELKTSMVTNLATSKKKDRQAEEGDG